MKRTQLFIRMRTVDLRLIKEIKRIFVFLYLFKLINDRKSYSQEHTKKKQDMIMSLTNLSFKFISFDFQLVLPLLLVRHMELQFSIDHPQLNAIVIVRLVYQVVMLLI